MQNLATNFALAAWPIVSIILFMRLPFRAAVIWTILGAQLLLPVGAVIKIPMIPAFDKTSIPSLCVFAACLATKVKRGTVRKFGLVELFLAVIVLGPLVTSELNGDMLVFGDRVIAGVGLYDAISTMELALITLIPFFVGRWYFRDETSNALMLKSLVVAMTAYSFLLLFEVRFSPQLHYWVYGYYPSDFVQAVRSGEFRPMAFMGHGLIAARFVLLAFLASVCLWTVSKGFKRTNVRSSALLGVMIFFSRTVAVFVYSAILAPCIAFARPRRQIQLAVFIATLALLYPAARALDVFPTNILLSTAAAVSEDRAQSLKVRFDNEDLLLARALERPLFGWGRYGRSRVYNDDGRDDSVTDGQWVLTLGQFGVFGFLAQFGLLCVGIFRSRNAIVKAATESDARLLATLALMMAITVLDLLPNSGLEPWTWLMCGSLVGRSDALMSLRTKHVPAPRGVGNVPATTA